MLVKNIEKRNRIISTAIILSMIIPVASMLAAPGDAGPAGDYPTLRCYGYQNFGAGDISISDPLSGETVEDPPYTDAVAPFNPQHAQAPVKDSITFNPVYLSEQESVDELAGPTGEYQDQIKASSNDANEKVFMRMWYEPWHWDKDVDGSGDMYGPWYDEELLHGEWQWIRYLPVSDLQDLDWLDDDDEIYPAIMQEYTYMFIDFELLDDKPEPIGGEMGLANTLLFPIGIRQDSTYEYFWSPYGYGLTGLDADFDGDLDHVRVWSEKSLFDHTGIAADFDGNQYIDPLDKDGYQLSGDELAIFTAESADGMEFAMERGSQVQFLDHMIEVVDTYRNTMTNPTGEHIPAVKVAIWYTGDLEPEFLGYQVIDENDMVLVGRKLPVTYIRSVKNDGPGTNLCDFPTGPWFIWVRDVSPSDERASIMVGRALGHAHTAMEDGEEEQDLRHGDPWWLKRFYVDGHEYNVVAIETVVATEAKGLSRGWSAADTNWSGPCPPGTVYPVSGDNEDDNYSPCYYYNDLDAAWAGEGEEDDGQAADNPLVDNNMIEDAPFDLFDDNSSFKFITIRTPIPKAGQRQNPDTHEIEYACRDMNYSQQPSNPVTADNDAIRNYGYYHLIEQHSIRLQPYFEQDMLSVLPPYNYEHSVVLDIQKNWSGIWDMDREEWVSEPEWIGDLKIEIPPITQTEGNYLTDDGRTITPEHMYYVDEDINDQYKGELKEKLYEWTNDTVTQNATIDPDLTGQYNLTVNLTTYLNNTGLNEGWYVEEWNTIPDEYTEFILPPGGTYDEENPYLYLMTSSFWDWEAIGRVLNQELGEKNIVDERMSDIDEVPGVITDIFGADLLNGFDDRDGPFGYSEMVWYLWLIYNDAVAPDEWPLWGSAWSGSYTNGIQHIDGNRVKFWFDPMPLTTETGNDVKKYKYGEEGYSIGTEGIRLYGFDSVGAGAIWATDPFVGDRDNDGDDDIIEYPPYTDPMAPFNPQSDEAPGKDSLTFDPAYMNEYHHGGEVLSALYKLISIEESDAREKVFFRMWYEPWHWDKDVNSDGSPLGPDAIWLLDPDFQEVWWWPVAWLQGKSVPSDPTKDGYVEKYAGQAQPELYGRSDWEFLDKADEIHPALMQEFTYMYVNPYDKPDHGQPGTSRFAFPMGTSYDELWGEFGYGINTFDANFDGVEDICTIHSELSLSKRTGIQADFNGDGVLQMLDADDTALNGNELVIFAVENINLDADPTTDLGDEAMFLDALVKIAQGGISEDSVRFEGYRTGGTTLTNIQPKDLTGGGFTLSPGEMALIRHTDVGATIPAGGNNLGDTDGGWFIYLESLDYQYQRCVVTIGRALGATFTAMDVNGAQDLTNGDPWYLKRFYVDGHEYNVVAIMTVKEETLQAGGWNNSKEECYEFKYITIRTEVPKVPVVIDQHSVRKQEYIPCSDGEDQYLSVMPPFNYHHTCLEDVQAGWSDPEWLSDHGYSGEAIKNKPPLQIHIEEETREPQFKGELKEKYNKRPLVEKMTLPSPVADLEIGEGVISGIIDGRWVTGDIIWEYPWVDGPDEDVASAYLRWHLYDAGPTAPDDLIYNKNGQVMSDMWGRFQLMEENDNGVWEDNGDEYWVMCVDYLGPYWDEDQGRFVLNEDYMCFYAVDVNNDGNFFWLPAGWEPEGETQIIPEIDMWKDWEVWMTEQWHTIPDLYTDISINQGTDEDKHQLYMLTSSWYSDQSQLLIPYYEDGTITTTGQLEWFEFYVPEILFEQPSPVTIEIFLFWTHDIQDLNLLLFDGTRNTGLDISESVGVSQEVISYEVTEHGKYWVQVYGENIIPDLAPEWYNLYIEVRGQGARVKFWYDPEDCSDIYVNTWGGGACNPGKGDINMDCIINFNDFVEFANSYNNPGAYTPCFDFDDDGDIDFTDFVEFANRYGLCSCRTTNCPECSCNPTGNWVYWEPTDSECPCCP